MANVLKSKKRRAKKKGRPGRKEKNVLDQFNLLKGPKSNCGKMPDLGPLGHSFLDIKLRRLQEAGRKKALCLRGYLANDEL